MKKFILSLVLCCIALCGYSQEHLSFKGIPITGPITTFCQKLKAKGFTQQAVQGNSRMFTGEFTGRKATIGVGASENGKDVFTVIVFFDPSDSWNTLVKTYEHYKELYIEKYGEPTVSVENNPSTSDSNTALMYELFQGRVTYSSIFEAPGGLIKVSITNLDLNGGCVMIKYEDSHNVAAKRQSDLEDI